MLQDLFGHLVQDHWVEATVSRDIDRAIAGSTPEAILVNVDEGGTHGILFANGVVLVIGYDGSLRVELPPALSKPKRGKADPATCEHDYDHSQSLNGGGVCRFCGDTIPCL